MYNNICKQLLIIYNETQYFDYFFFLKGSKNLYDSNISSTHKSIDPTPYEAYGLTGNLTCDTVRVSNDKKKPFYNPLKCVKVVLCMLIIVKKSKINYRALYSYINV